ncbi:hypothetical protein L0P85_03730 [Terrisporobacter glycolicus]|nr:hypothetical protein L0P85_03730 [Terrisporobacter glycolicus]
MKRQYEKPSMSIDMFEANEYIATCAVATCNINVSEDDNLNVAYREKNNKPGYQKGNLFQKGDERFYRGNKACGTKFTAKLEDLKPYLHDSNGSSKGGTISQVYYWKDGWNSHFTTGYQETASSTA